LYPRTTMTGARVLDGRRSSLNEKRLAGTTTLSPSWNIITGEK
jgi:hypothetical protein